MISFRGCKLILQSILHFYNQMHWFLVYEEDLPIYFFNDGIHTIYNHV
jgi:hypothetical protein